MSRDYPTEEEVARVAKFKFNSPNSFTEFMTYVKAIGKYWPQESFVWTQRGRTFSISTGGWSGNEAILDAMERNMIFWMVCWQSHRRGGHYQFKLPDPAVFFRTHDATGPIEEPIARRNDDVG